MNTYDELPYDSLCIPETHPGRLAVLAHLFGLDAPDPATCRLLEFGCASGGNLIPMAAELSHARFVGIDLASAQVDAGHTRIAALGLDNIELRAGDVLDLGDDLGTFDFVIAHGLYSWVPEPVRERLLGVIAARLSPGGIAYVSYNCLPGWRMRGMLRDILLDVAGTGDAPSRVEAARAALERLHSGLVELPGLAAEFLRDEIPRLAEAPDSYLLHEFLAPDNHACLFRDFATQANAAGLRYLCDTRLSTLFPSSLGDNTATALADIDDGIDLEQWMDFLSNRRFRQSLLYRADGPADEGLSLERFAGYAFGADLATPQDLEPSSESPVIFRCRDGEEVPVSHPLTKALLTELTRRYPQTLPLSHLMAPIIQRVEQEAGTAAATNLDACLMELFEIYARNALVLTLTPRNALDIGNRPEATPLSHCLIAAGAPQLPTVDHQNLDLDDLAARLLTFLDGTKDLHALTAAIRDDLVSGRLTPKPIDSNSQPLDTQNVERSVRQLVGLFRRYGLLSGKTPPKS